MIPTQHVQLNDLLAVLKQFSPRDDMNRHKEDWEAHTFTVRECKAIVALLLELFQARGAGY